MAALLIIAYLLAAGAIFILFVALAYILKWI